MELTTQASGDPDFGIALNGGGSRALCCSWGYLRALHHMGILNKAAYISGVSGSGWGLVHLSYSPVPLDEVLTMQRLPSPPESIPDYKADGQVRADLDVMPWGRLGASSWVGVGDASFLNLGRLVNVIDGFLLKVLPPYNFWTWMIGKIFLEPNGIDPSKVTASDEAAVKRAMAADARLKADDFILKRPELTPTPLIAITLAGPAWPRLFQHTTRVQAAHWATTGDDDTQEVYRDAVKHRDENGGATLVSFSISPDEITCPYDGPPMETSAFACHIPTPPLTVGKGSVGVTDFIQSRLGKCWPRAFGPNKCLGPQVLSVGDVAGTTSSAVGDLVQGESRKGNLCCQVLTERPIDLLAEHVFLQGYRASPTFNGQDAQELEFFDGGLHECSGVTGLLQKKVKRILLMASGPAPYRTLAECNGEYAQTMDSACSPLWGVRKDSRTKGGYIYSQNQVFEFDAFKKLVAQFDECRAAGRPLIASLKGMKVLANPFYGIEAYGEVDIVWYYMDAPRVWKEAVGEEVMAKATKDGKDPGFPMLASGGGYTCAQANLMADLSCWAVLSAADKFKQLASGPG